MTGALLLERGDQLAGGNSSLIVGKGRSATMLRSGTTSRGAGDGCDGAGGSDSAGSIASRFARCVFCARSAFVRGLGESFLAIMAGRLRARAGGVFGARATG